MGHIELARWADDVLIAPATADFMAHLAGGFADDLLTTLCLATEAPIALAPAMNRLMWANPATQGNRDTLLRRGLRLLGPGEGDQACGEVGSGRMLEPLELVGLLAAPRQGPLSGVHVLITAGPTREPIDPVRYLSNRSSGRMGFAIAAAAAGLGARVTLVAGPSAQATPPAVTRIDVESAAEMMAAVDSRVAEADIFVAAAAVADYGIAEPAAEKIKKRDDAMTLNLVKTPDILQNVAARNPRPFVVGFAAETEALADHARAKLARKRLDMIAANWVGGGRGFDSERNALEVFWEGGHHGLGESDKGTLAWQLMALITDRYNETRQTEDP